MNRADAIKFCHKYSEKRFYQPVIFVPGVIEIQGKWNRDTRNLASWLFGSIAGKTVLDLGCNTGFFVRDALRRGASSAIGVDHDQIEIDIANEISDIMKDGLQIEYHKIEKYNPPHPFDIILMLNILHVIDDPAAVIERYLKYAGLLVIEHVESQRHYFPCQPTKSIKSVRCAGYRTLSCFGDVDLMSNSSR